MATPLHPRPFMTRRNVFAFGGAAALAGMSLAGCDLLETEADSEGSGPEDEGQQEAPSLAEQVANGNLEPLRDRLPAEPLVVEPESEPGVYGGMWRTFIQTTAGAAMYENIGYDPLTRWTRDFVEVVPNVVSWEPDEDGRAFTLTSREGLKWSDGEPFTADDIVFAFADVLSNEELYPDFPDWLAPGGEPGQVEKIDDYTVRFTFAVPHAFFPQWLARPEANILAASPKHYLQQFHADYNDDIDQLVEDEGFADWTELYFGKGGAGVNDLPAWQNRDLPMILPWTVSTPLTGQELVAERNPYYWKTDTEGRQLPYIDEVRIEVIDSPETAVLRTSQGEFTLPSTDVLTPMNKPVLADSREEGNYSFLDQKTSDVNAGVFCLNLTHTDPALREVFNNLDFRIGLSHAINRSEMIDAVHQRQGEPYQSAPRPESDFYNETLASQYLEYDVDLANEHLDRAGYTERNDDGIRLRPDGEPISFAVDLPTGFDPTYPSSVEIVKEYWREVGVDIRIESIEGARFFERIFNNEHDAVIYTAESGLKDAILDPGWFMPIGGRCYYARQWADWYHTGGDAGEEPPEPVLRQYEIYDQIRETIDEDEQRQLFAEALEISVEQFYAIGTALIAGRYSIVQNDFINVPNPIPEGSVYPDPAPAQPEQFFRRA